MHHIKIGLGVETNGTETICAHVNQFYYIFQTTWLLCVLKGDAIKQQILSSIYLIVQIHCSLDAKS